MMLPTRRAMALIAAFTPVALLGYVWGGAIDLLMEDRIFKSAGDRIIVEERLTGEEASMIVISDGKTALPLVASQDHKRLQDGDHGPNTGGMGAYAPAPVVTPAITQQVMDQVIQPTLHGMANEGIPLTGVLYAGLMLTPEGPKVLEYNVRFGDPEIQAILPLLKSDLVPILDEAVEGRLADARVEWNPGACACVVVASGGYPGEYATGKPISGLDAFKGRRDMMAFHAGTRRDGNRILTSGGRVLNIIGTGPDIEQAVKRAYEGVGKIEFEKMHYRKDIGFRAMNRAATTKG